MFCVNKNEKAPRQDASSILEFMPLSKMIRAGCGDGFEAVKKYFIVTYVGSMKRLSDSKNNFNSAALLSSMVSTIVSILLSAGLPFATLRWVLLPVIFTIFKRSPSFLVELQQELQERPVPAWILLCAGISTERIFVKQQIVLMRILFARRHNILITVLTVLHYILSWILSLTIGLWLCTRLLQYHYDVRLRSLLDHHRWKNATQNAMSETYYHRHCSVEDLSTSNMSDLILRPQWEATKAVDILYKHGAAVFRGVVNRTVADAFRNYTLLRNRKLTKEESVYVMNTYNSRHKHRQARWSFAISHNDNTNTDATSNHDVNRDIVAPLLHQVATSPLLVETVEMLLGPDPAVIKMQTITAKQGAEHQSWHPDVNAYGSAKTYARHFVQHWSLFIPLQDTLGDMGATGLCPGSHYCSKLENDLVHLRAEQGGCGQVHSGYVSSSTDNNTSSSINRYDGEPRQPVWMTGDAVLMNQNTYHRGWKYSNPKNKHRAIVVITFTSRPRYPQLTSPRRPQQQQLRRSPTWTPLPFISRSSHYLRRFIGQSLSPLSTANSKPEATSETAITVDSDSFPQPSYRFTLPNWQDDTKLKGQASSSETRSLGLGTPLTSFGLTLQDLRIESSSSTMTNVQCHNMLGRWLSWGRFLGLYKPPRANWGWDYMTSVWSRISAETHKFQEEDLADWLHSKKQGSTLSRLWVEYALYDKVPKQDAQRLDRGIWDVWYSKSLGVSLGCLHWISQLLGSFFFLVSLGLMYNQSVYSKSQFMSPRRVGRAFWRSVQPQIVVIVFLGSGHCIVERSWLYSGMRCGNSLRSIFPNATTFTTDDSPISPVPMAGVRRITHGRGNIQHTTPTPHDVLFGTRLDSLHLWAINRILDYHPGNQQWQELMQVVVVPVQSQKNRRPLVEQPEFLQEAIVESVVRKSRGRFLLQLPENGSFTILTKKESRQYTRKAIMVEENPLLFLLDETVSYMISGMRYESSLRTTPLCVIAIGVLEEIRERLFRVQSVTKSNGNLPVPSKKLLKRFGTTGVVHKHRATQLQTQAPPLIIADPETGPSSDKNKKEARKTPPRLSTRAQRRRERSLAYLK